MPIRSMINTPMIPQTVYQIRLYFFPLMSGSTMATIGNAQVYAPYGAMRYPMPAPPPINTGRPTAPRRNQTSTIRNDSFNGNSSAIKNTTKLRSVIFGAIGSGVGMLRYALMHNNAANNAQITNFFVEILGFAAIVLFSKFMLSPHFC